VFAGAGLQTDDHSLCVRQVLPKAANFNVQQPLRRSLQELNELCRAVNHSQSSTPAADESADGTSPILQGAARRRTSRFVVFAVLQRK